MRRPASVNPPRWITSPTEGEPSYPIPGERGISLLAKAYGAGIPHILLSKEMVRMRMPALPKNKREPKRSYLKMLMERLFKSKKRRPFIKVPERK